MGIDITHLLDSLGWALLHSFWQCGLAFIAVACLRIGLKQSGPSLRYAVQLSVLVACFAAFLITFGIYFKSGLQIDVEGLGSLAASQGALSFAELTSPISGPFSNSLSAIQSSFEVNVAKLTPLIAIAWCLGFAFVALRYGAAFWLTQRLRSRGISMPSRAWIRRFQTLALNAGLPSSTRLYFSKYVSAPVTLGFIKPVVLVPVGFLTGLPQDQVEAILLHEIAHIRRYDYALNLLQTAIVTVFFFHPAIHYISRRIDIDREQACDDLAVAQNRNPRALAKGLASLRLKNSAEAQSLVTPLRMNASFVMNAMGDGRETPLLDRLARLTGPAQSPRRAEHMIMSAAAALLIGALYIGATASANASQNGNSEPKETTQSSSKSLSHAEGMLEFAQTALEPMPQDGKRAFEKSHDPKNRLQEKLYQQLLNDGMIGANDKAVTLQFVDKTWTVNGVAVPAKSESNYCRIMANMGLEKAAQTRIEIFPEMRMLSAAPIASPPPVTLVQANAPAASAAPMPPFMVPTSSSEVNVRFGMTDKAGVQKHRQKHTGIDIKADAGSPVYASREGVVSFAANKSDWGNLIIVKHADGYQSFYAHLDRFKVKRGQAVSPGQIIGVVGATGKTPGPHLHFEIRKDGAPIDPAPLIF